MNQSVDTISAGLTQAWTSFMNFLPAFLLFVVILVVGYFIAKLVGKLVTAVLHRMDFNRVGHRPLVKQLSGGRTYDYSRILGLVAKWTLFVFVLQLAFSAFGPNPVSTIITSFIFYLPNIFYAAAILLLASLLGVGVQRLLEASLGRFSFGRTIASVVGGLIIAVGIFAALNELQVAPAIVNGLFYALLVLIVGSGVIAIGCGGIAPMRAQWDHALGRLNREGMRLQAETTMGGPPPTTVESMRREVIPPAEEVHHEEERASGRIIRPDEVR